MIGALCHYVTHAETKSFQPMKANFGILPMPESRMTKADRYTYYGKRALTNMRRFARDRGLPYDRLVAESLVSIDAEKLAPLLANNQGSSQNH